MSKAQKKTANVSTLKARLSYYLKLVKGGQELIVLDRNLPVARLVAIEAASPLAEVKFLELILPQDKQTNLGAIRGLILKGRETDILKILMDDREE